MFSESIGKICSALSEAAQQADIDGKKQFGTVLGRLERSTLRVAVFGRFSSGKSLFLNTMLGQPELLPVGLTPTTKVITELQYGEESAINLIFRDGSPSVTMTLAEYKNIQTIDNIRKAVIFVPCEILKQITFVDTPGISDPDYIPLELVYEEIPAADVVVVLLASMNAFSQEEQIFVREKIMRRDLTKVIFILNQIDLLTADQLADVQERAQQIAERLTGKCQVIPYSARKAYLALNSGNTDLRNEANYPNICQLFTEELISQTETIHKLSVISSLQDTLIYFKEQINNIRSMAGNNLDQIQQAVQRVQAARQQAEHTLTRLEKRAASYLGDLEKFYLIGLNKFSDRFQEQLPDKLAATGTLETIHKNLPHYIEYSFKVFLEDYNQEFTFFVNRTVEQISNDMSLELQEIVRDTNLKLHFVSGFLPKPNLETSNTKKIDVAAAVVGVVSLFTGNFLLGALVIGANEVLRRFTKKQREEQGKEELAKAGQTVIRDVCSQVEESFKGEFAKLSADIQNWLKTSWNERLAELESELVAACERKEQLTQTHKQEDEKLILLGDVIAKADADIAALIEEMTAILEQNITSVTAIDVTV